MNEIVIFGTGEIAELTDFYIRHDPACEYEVVAFTADDEFVEDETFLDRPLVPFSKIAAEYPPDRFRAHVALSYRRLNEIRAAKYHAMKKAGYQLASYVCSKSCHWPDLHVGDNCLILENQTIQPGVEIGNNVMIWSGNHLGHGARIEDHVYISSHVCISGHARIGEGSFLGVNATVKDFVTIGKKVFVAMGASVAQDIEDDAVVLEARGSVFPPEDKLAKRLKQKYFGISE